MRTLETGGAPKRNHEERVRHRRRLHAGSRRDRSGPSAHGAELRDPHSATCRSCASGDGCRVLPTAATVAIVGQPNCGKTSIFNLLTGARQYVGNWAGVTVEKKAGSVLIDDTPANVVDLPGTYGLVPTSIEESVTRGFLEHGAYDAIVDVVDASVLQRQLYLTLQLLSLDRPLVVALTMTDELLEQGNAVDTVRLSELLGCPVVGVNGRTGVGLDLLKTTIGEVLLARDRMQRRRQWEGDVVSELLRAATALREYDVKSEGSESNSAAGPDFHALLYFLDDDTETERVLNLEPVDRQVVEDCKGQVSLASGGGAARRTTDWLFGTAKGVSMECTRHTGGRRVTRERVTAALDSLALHPVVGIPFFLVVLLAMFELTFRIGDLAIGWLDAGLGALAALASRIPVDWIGSLVANGVIGGAGNVLLVAPYVLLVFLFLSFLEDSGYMARAAYIMDHFMHRLGLHGKAFIPLVLGFGCNVPAIMAARSLEAQNDRLKTILMTPFMSCSARLTVYVFLGGALFGRNAGLVVFGLYVGGILAGLLTAFVLSRTVLKGMSAGFIMELPPYRLPRLGNLLINTWNKMREFIQKAGTLILLLSLAIWALSYFPAGAEFGGEHSLIGMLGGVIAPLLRPLHFNAAMTVGLIAGFTAKEVVIATLGVISGAGAAGLQAALPSMMDPATALAYLVFVLLYTPCLAAVSVIRSETGSFRWTMFSIGYGLVLAYGAALATRTVAVLSGMA